MAARLGGGLNDDGGAAGITMVVVIHGYPRPTTKCGVNLDGYRLLAMVV